MTRRFEKDDRGYLAWLEAHPDGYVLNTYMQVTSDYLVLHRARCRFVNRPLALGRSWTAMYGKTCTDDRAELEAWALREGGGPAHPCGHCLAKGHPMPGSAVRAPSSGRSLGSRGPGMIEQRVAMAGDGVTVRIEPMTTLAPDAPPLVIEGAQWLAETFFRQDPSAAESGSYDAWIRQTQGDLELRDRIVDADVTAVNTTMAARTSHAAWAEIIAADDWSWLAALDPAWDLFEVDDETWVEEQVPAKLDAAFTAMRRSGLHLAVITKVLHIKRPRLIPVLDSLVIGQIGGRVTDDIATWVAVLEHLRTIGKANLEVLRAVRAHLQSEGLPERSLVRILDSLLWTCAPGSAMSGELADWERVFRPRPVDPGQ